MDDFTRSLLSSGKSAQEARLTKCPACQKEISTRAPACPHCGEPMKSSVEVAHGGAVALPMEEEIKSILQRDSKIAAIRRVRELTGGDLLVAPAVVVAHL